MKNIKRLLGGEKKESPRTVGICAIFGFLRRSAVEKRFEDRLLLCARKLNYHARTNINFQNARFLDIFQEMGLIDFYRRDDCSNRSFMMRRGK